jgi:hypothetical protein
MPEDRLQQAISMSRAGDKEEARQLLSKILEDEKNNEVAWLWLADTMPDDEHRMEVLQESLFYNPDFELARKGLETLKKKHANNLEDSAEIAVAQEEEITKEGLIFESSEFETSEEQPVSQPVSETPSPQPAKKSSRGWVLFFLILLILLLAGVALVAAGVLSGILTIG